MSQEKTGELFAKQLEVDKHFKMKCAAGQLDIHAGSTCLGLWLVKEGSKGDDNSIGMICEPNGVYFQMWPDRSFYKDSRNRLPFAFSSSIGLQVPHPDGTTTTISLNELSDLVKSFKK